MHFHIDRKLLAHARAALAGWQKLYWIVGGAGAGKTTICQVLASRYAIPLYDMDAHIYGAYHARFDPARHPVNTAWSTAANGLAWLLAMSWEEFDSFNRAALAEYLDLLALDLQAADPAAGVLIDGGICNPGLLVQVIPARQMVCLASPPIASAELWAADSERGEMKAFIDQLPEPEAAWRTFLEFDERITQTMLQESLASSIPVCRRSQGESVDAFASRVAHTLGVAHSKQ